MNRTALIFGAGKTGRGFAAHLAFLGGYNLIFIDKNRQLVADLKEAGEYRIQVLGNEEMNCSINFSEVYSIDDASWHNEFIQTGLIFTAVFGNNLENLSRDLAIVFRKRHIENPDKVLTIITCENLVNAAHFLREMVFKNFGEQNRKWLAKTVGFCESIIFKTCVEASKDQPALTIRAQNFFELPCDGDALKEELHVYGLKPLRNFRDQLKRKIFTYNCINAVITYLGAKKGYTQLYEAGNDAEILRTAVKAANETCRAQVAEFGFDAKEQQEWMNAALAKFADKNIPDPLDRNGADPDRKLGREDRLIGPALLSLKHNIFPEGLLAGIIAGFDYRDSNRNYCIRDVIMEKGADLVLKEVCGLSAGEELFMLIKERIVK